LSFAASLLARRNFKDADSGSLACPLEHLHLLMSRLVAAVFECSHSKRARLVLRDNDTVNCRRQLTSTFELS